MAAAAEVISLFVAGPGILFPIGLVIGTGVSVIGFLILVRSGQFLVDSQSSAPVILGYGLRIILYGIAFLVCIKISVPCGFGCGCGILSIHCGILFLYGIVYPFIKHKKNPLNDWTEPKEWNDLSVYDEEDDWDDWDDIRR